MLRLCRILIIVLLLLLALIVTYMRVVGLAQPLFSVLDLISVDSRYQPGSPKPPELACEYYVPPEDIYRYCSVHTARGNLTILVKYKRIERVYMYLPKGTPVTAGHLLLLWGNPKGVYRNNASGVVMYWTQGWALANTGNGFSARSRVYYVGYGSGPFAYTAWEGFTSTNKEVLRATQTVVAKTMIAKHSKK